MLGSRLWSGIALLTTLFGSATAHGVTVYAVVEEPGDMLNLIHFDSATPGTIIETTDLTD
jgi:hypothetical protein